MAMVGNVSNRGMVDCQRVNRSIRRDTYTGAW
jgi:hypothetical protein